MLIYCISRLSVSIVTTFYITKKIFLNCIFLIHSIPKPIITYAIVQFLIKSAKSSLQARKKNNGIISLISLKVNLKYTHICHNLKCIPIIKYKVEISQKCRICLFYFFLKAKMIDFRADKRKLPTFISLSYVCFEANRK